MNIKKAGDPSMKKLVQFIYFFLCGMLLFSITALAYIDPSAMTYMIQLVAGIAIAAGAGASYYFHRLKRKFFRRDKSHSSIPTQNLKDDDDIGYGDYELDTPSSPAADPSVTESVLAAETSAPKVTPAPISPLYTSDAVAAGADPYDETGGTAGLAAENRELRRLLARERQNVEELKRALHICTAPRK